MEGNKIQFYFEETSLNRINLFKEALSSAENGRVLYILHEELSQLPTLSQDLNSVNRHFMKMISFLYVETIEALIDSVSTLPDWQNVPSTIILDDLSKFFSRNNQQNIYGIIALLMDSVRICSVSLGKPCNLFVAVSKEVVGDDFCKILKELYF